MEIAELYQKGLELDAEAERLEESGRKDPAVNCQTTYQKAAVLRKEAACYWKQAAEQGHVDAQYRLALYFYYGKKNNQAFYWCKMAAEQGLPMAQYTLGSYYCGVGVVADTRKSIFWREKAFENVKDCVVRVIMGNAYGSGILWELTADRVIIATNSHVLAYWQQEDSCLLFPQGYFVEAKVLGLSSQYDVGFLEVDNGQFTYAELERLRSAAVEAEGYEQLEPGMSMFCVGAGPEAGEMLFHEAELEDRARYIADFGAVMLYGYGFARTGMSGGGMFDGYGRLIGMVTGGTQQNEVAGVPLPSMEEAYQEVVNEASRFTVQSE